MAVKVKRVLVCDVCETEEGVKTWAIRFPGQKGLLELQLCKEHSSPLEALKRAVKGRARPARGIVARDYESIPRVDNGVGH